MSPIPSIIRFTWRSCWAPNLRETCWAECNERVARQYRYEPPRKCHLSGPNTHALTQGAVCVGLVFWCNVWVVCNLEHSLSMCRLFEAFDLPQWLHVFLLLVAVSSTFRDFKSYLRCEIGRACCLEKCLKQLREAKKHEVIVEGQRLRKPAHHGR